jgi:hypothetical protein
MSSVCKGKLASSSPLGLHRKLSSGSNHSPGQNSREWARSPPSTFPYPRDRSPTTTGSRSRIPWSLNCASSVCLRAWSAGVPSLAVEHVVCRKGDKLTSEQVRISALVHFYILLMEPPFQAQLLKLRGDQTVMFKVALRCMWDKESGKITEGQPAPVNTGLVLLERKEMRREATRKWNDSASRRLNAPPCASHIY